MRGKIAYYHDESSYKFTKKIVILFFKFFLCHLKEKEHFIYFFHDIKQLT